MKDLEVTLTLRNNRLKERRLLLDMTQKEFAAAVGVPLSYYATLEQLRKYPRTESGEWSAEAVMIADFHCTTPEDLFPESVAAVKTPVAVKKIDASEAFPLLSTHQERLLESPEDAYARAESIALLRERIDELPPREQHVIIKRFGLDGEGERTYKDVGLCTTNGLDGTLGITGHRVKGIEDRAMSSLTRGAVVRDKYGDKKEML